MGIIPEYKKKKSKKKAIIDKFIKQHKDESFEDETEIANELSAFMILHNMENITDSMYIAIIKELKYIYLGEENHY